MKKISLIISLFLLALLTVVFFSSTAKAPAPIYPLTISVSGLGSTAPQTGTYYIGGGGELIVTAIPDSGWKFDHWILDSVNVGSENPYTVVMDTGHSLTAVFLAEFDLTVSVTGSGSTSPEAGVHTYADGTSVAVTATPNSGWKLDHWIYDSANVGSTNPYEITMNKDHSLIAVFTEGTTEKNGNGSFSTKTHDVPVDENTFVIETCSNSSVSGFVFDPSLKRLRFNVDGSLGTIGLCDLAIPSELMWGDFSIYLDDTTLVKNVDYTETNNGTHYLFSISYEHSTHIIDVISTEAIPELPLWIILPLTVSATLLAIYYRKKLKIWKINIL